MYAAIVDVIKQDKLKYYNIVEWDIVNKQISNCRTYKGILSDELIATMTHSKNLNLVNGLVVKGKTGYEIKGKEASLDRFSGNIKPYTILARIETNEGKLLGFVVASSNGDVRNIRNKELLEMCESINSKGGTPLQNAMYMSGVKNNKGTGVKGPYIKAYKNIEFPIVVVNMNKGKKRTVEKVKMETIPENKKKENIQKMSELFTDEQLVELKQAKEAGVNIKVIANPKFSPEQMHIIWETEAEGLPGKLFAYPEIPEGNMELYKDDLENGLDISNRINPKFNIGQLMQLSLAEESGFRMDRVCGPEVSAREMRELRTRTEGKLWSHLNISVNGEWKSVKNKNYKGIDKAEADKTSVKNKDKLSIDSIMNETATFDIQASEIDGLMKQVKSKMDSFGLQDYNDNLDKRCKESIEAVMNGEATPEQRELVGVMKQARIVVHKVMTYAIKLETKGDGVLANKIYEAVANNNIFPVSVIMFDEQLACGDPEEIKKSNMLWNRVNLHFNELGNKDAE